MRVTRLLLDNFRGWPHLDLRPSEHVVLAGVPRAGRSDIIAALRRVLDPASARTQPALTDIRQERAPASQAPRDDDDPSCSSRTDLPENAPPGRPAVVRAAFASIEVTLAGLDPQVHQLCDGYLEPLAADGQVDDTSSADPAAELGVRLAYRLSYDPITEMLDSHWYFPVRSVPDIAQFDRVPAVVREALPVVVLGSARPLQLRAGGTFRRLLADRDAQATTEAIADLLRTIGAAADTLLAHPVVADTLTAVLGVGGLLQRLGDDDVDTSRLGFLAEDGSVSALLRTLHPALELDSGGTLPLGSHGSTASAVLAAAEAVSAVDDPGAVVLADDLGDQMDSATSEQVAALLRDKAGQAWISTRRPEVARAFTPAALIRLTRHGGIRKHHTLGRTTDRHALAARRNLHTQLLPALTFPTVIVVEGPHDVTTYAAVDRWPGRGGQPLVALGARLVSADNGNGGGITQIPRVAELARELGFRVVALIDGDRPGGTVAADLERLEDACDAVVVLPEGVAIEAAITWGVSAVHLRSAATVLPAYGVPDPTIGEPDDQVGKTLWKVIHRQGLHEPVLDVLLPEGGVPPLLAAALTAVATAVIAVAGTAGPVVPRLRRVNAPQGPTTAGGP